MEKREEGEHKDEPRRALCLARVLVLDAEMEVECMESVRSCLLPCVEAVEEDV